MNHVSRAARAYYQANVRAWLILRRNQEAFLAVAISVYLGTALMLHFTGHATAGWWFTGLLGLPVIALTWGGVLTIRK
jgi:hypothetical protein